MFIKLKRNDVNIESLLIAFFATSGSFYSYYVPSYVRLFLAAIWGILIVKSIIRHGEAYFPIDLLFYLALIGITIRNNPIRQSNTAFISFLLYSISLMFVFFAYYQDYDWYGKTIKTMLVPYFIYSAYTIAMHFIPQLVYVTYGLFRDEDVLIQYERNGLAGLTGHYSLNAILIANGLMIVVCIIMIDKQNYKAIVYAMLSLLALLWTGKRAHIIFAVVALVITDFLYLSNNKKIRRKHMIMIVAGVGGALAAIIYLFPSLSTFITRFEETAESGDVTLGRVDNWLLAWDLFKTHPILGIGWGRYKEFHLLGYEAHNVYIQLLCETGIVGTLFYITFMGYSLFVTYKVVKNNRKEMLMSNDVDNKKKAILSLVSLSNQIFFLIYCFTGTTLYTKENYIPYFIACAYAISEYRKMKKSLQQLLWSK